MKKIVEKVLSGLATRILRKYKPQVIAVTGSVGKTSAKEAIFTVLQTKYKNRVARSLKNFNNEFGLPLTILRADSAGGSALGWLAIIFKGFQLLFSKDDTYPQVFVLEMGADHVGDIKHLLDIAPADVGVLTAIGPSHLEYFETLENIAREKSQILTKLPKTGLAVINRDDQLAMSFKDKTSAGVVTFGFRPDSDVSASELVISESDDMTVERVQRIRGVSFKLTHKGSTVPFHIPGVVGVQHVYAALAAVAVGLSYEINLVDMVQAIKLYRAAPGRMNLIPGIKRSMIIDDTYNAAPVSAKAALDVFSRIDLPKPSEKWAILGDMLELGSYSEQGHAEVGQKVFESGATYLVTVGEKARDIGRAARQAGMPEANVYQFPTVDEAANFVQNRMEKGDFLLIKGSQGARMEKIVKELMSDPLSAPSLLVRQGEEWKK